MALDTATKRLGFLGFGGGDLVLVVPDNDSTALDRATRLGGYTLDVETPPEGASGRSARNRGRNRAR